LPVEEELLKGSGLEANPYASKQALPVAEIGMLPQPVTAQVGDASS